MGLFQIDIVAQSKVENPKLFADFLQCYWL